MAATLVAAINAAVTPPTAPAAERTYVAPGFSAAAAVYKPQRFFASGNATLEFTKVRWSRYDGEVAHARARGRVNDCRPACFNGTYRSYPARIRYDRRKRTCGRRFYTRLFITWTERVPPGLKRSSYFLSDDGVSISC